MKFKTFLTFGLASLTLAYTAAAHSAVEFDLRFASAAPEGTPWVKHAEALRDNVAVNSENQVAITLFNNAQLGKEIDAIKQVARGRIDMGAFSMSGVSSIIPELSLTLAPYLWDSYEQVDCALDNHLGQVLEPYLEKKNLKLLQWNELGYSNMFGSQPILSPTDASDLKMRVSIAPAASNFYDAIGINGIYIPFSETPSALQTGLVEGGSMQSILYVAAGFGKVSPHYTLTRHAHEAGMILINLDLWKRMGDDFQQVFVDSLAPQASLRAGLRGMDSYLVGQFKQAGGQVYELTDEQLALWKTKGASKHHELVEDIGGNADELWKQIQIAKSACSK